MKKDKNRFDWIKNLDDHEITRLANKADLPFQLSEKTKYKVLTMIMNSDRIASEEKKSSRLISKPAFGFALSFAVVFLIIISLFSIIYLTKTDLFIFQTNRSKFMVSSVTGEAFRQKKNGEKSALKTGDEVSENSILMTSDRSVLELTLNEKSFIKIDENSLLNIDKLYKKNETTDTGLSIKNGMVSFELAELNRESKFEVETGQFVINVVGTDFSVKVTDDGSSSIIVNEGEVNARIKLNQEIYISLDKFKKEDAEKLRALIDREISVKKEQQIELNDKEVILLSQLLLEILKRVSYESSSEKIYEKFNIEIKNFNELKDKVLIEQTAVKEDKITETDQKKAGTSDDPDIYSLKFSLGINLTERETSVTSDGTLMYVTSDSNKKIFCIDFKNSSQQWAFFDADINKFTCAPVSFQNKLVLSTPFYIFAINSSGRAVMKKAVDKGTTYWAGIIKYGNKLFIPTSSTVFAYDGNTIIALPDFPETIGQIYLTVSGSNLFCSVPNEKKIKIYDIKQSKIVWTSEDLNQRTFMSPVVYKDEVVIIDSSGLVYKINYLDNSKKTLQLDAGVVSQPLLYADDIYFIANNGYFYNVSLKNFNNYAKISKIDNNPDSNKYLTKKILKYNKNFFITSDKGTLFQYDLNTKKLKEFFVNKEGLPLISTPVVINGYLYLIDSKSNLYQVVLK
ncbi:MAG: FecR domain-containing protein [Spirochaetes bacterium]|nr:FecR domain-containing protein [Spirochaetota bacterium]